MKRFLWLAAKALAAGFIITSLFFGAPFVYRAYKEASFDSRAFGYVPNTVFYDRQGRLLRFIPNGRGERCIYVRGNAIPVALKEAFIAAEDERFYSHAGFDVKAIARAAVDNLRAGRIVSGASTISQQLVRLAYPRGRNVHDKLVELFRSVELERRFSKDEILEKYLNRVPLGSNIVGVELASRVYFGKPCSMLTPAECALLASIPKAPTVLNPLGENRDRLARRRDWVLSRMHSARFLNGPAYWQALASKPAVVGYTLDYRAPHFVDLLIERGARGPGTYITTVDLDLQDALERVLKSHRTRLAKRSAAEAAAIIIHNPTMEALALDGSMDYLDPREGNNNGVTALRSAGSTLKPFLYALAIEKGHTAAETIQDIERKYRSPGGTYSPMNFDRRQYGPASMRLALGSSLNLAAVRMLDSIGCTPFYNTLCDLNLMNDRNKGPGYYGLGLAVGSPGVSLEQLTAAYAALANGGIYRRIRYTLGGCHDEGVKIFEPQTAYIVTDMLSDPTARSLTFGSSIGMDFPFKIALKTGTSTNYRDCWAVGYTPEYTVGVWVGNFSGSSTGRLSGSAAAVPMLYDVIDFLYKGGAPAEFKRPGGVITAKVCSLSGKRPVKGCPDATEELFIAGTEPRDDCIVHRNSDRHDLPAQYAQWVYDKFRRGTAGGYRIESLPEDLEKAFSQTDDGAPAVRIYGDVEKGSANMPAVTSSHYSIQKPSEKLAPSYVKNTLKITYPLDGDRFVLESGPPKVLRLTLLSDKPVAHVDWFVDGRQCREAGPPYMAYWELQRGRHVISTVDPAGNGDTVSITVE